MPLLEKSKSRYRSSSWTVAPCQNRDIERGCACKIRQIRDDHAITQQLRWKRNPRNEFTFSGSFEQLVGKNDRTSRQMRSWFSGVFACQKLQEFATGCVIRHMMSQLSFIIGTPKREQRATFVVDVVQDQLSWR